MVQDSCTNDLTVLYGNVNFKRLWYGYSFIGWVIQQSFIHSMLKSVYRLNINTLKGYFLAGSRWEEPNEKRSNKKT